MAESVGMLETSLRVQARKELEQEVKVSVDPMLNLLGESEWQPNGQKIALESDGGQTVTFETRHVLYRLRDHFISVLADRRGDQAIERFLTDVKDLKERISELEETHV